MCNNINKLTAAYRYIACFYSIYWAEEGCGRGPPGGGGGGSKFTTHPRLDHRVSPLEYLSGKVW